MKLPGNAFLEYVENTEYLSKTSLMSSLLTRKGFIPLLPLESLYSLKLLARNLLAAPLSVK